MARIALVTVPYFITHYHRTLAQRLLGSIQSTHAIDRIAIVNNVRAAEDMRWLESNVDYVEHNDTNILARAWNKGIRLGFSRGASHVIVTNMDVVFHPLCIDNLIECARQEPSNPVWSPTLWHDPATFLRARLSPTCSKTMSWSCFMIDHRLFEQVGEFDEKFIPAYLEDSDMRYRMHLKGLEGITSHAAIVLNTDRGTIKGLLNCSYEDIKFCSALLRDLRSCITNNDERYLQKWGGAPGHERFVQPFNGTPQGTP